MPTIDRRIERLEAAFPARCPRCKNLLTCETCQDWKQEARRHGIDPEQLTDTLARLLAEQIAGGGTHG